MQGDLVAVDHGTGAGGLVIEELFPGIARLVVLVVRVAGLAFGQVDLHGGGAVCDIADGKTDKPIREVIICRCTFGQGFQFGIHDGGVCGRGKGDVLLVIGVPGYDIGLLGVGDCIIIAAVIGIRSVRTLLLFTRHAVRVVIQYKVSRDSLVRIHDDCRLGSIRILNIPVPSVEHVIRIRGCRKLYHVAVGVFGEIRAHHYDAVFRRGKREREGVEGKGCTDGCVSRDVLDRIA